MTKPHPYSSILHAIANGEQIQFEYREGMWMDQDHELTLEEIIKSDWGPGCYRIKPKTIMVNGVECPKETKPPKYRVSITRDGVSVGTEFVELWYATREDAATVFNALVKPFKETT